MNTQKNEKLPIWNYRSDDNQMENLKIGEMWTLYKDSEEIEENF